MQAGWHSVDMQQRCCESYCPGQGHTMLYYKPCCGMKHHLVAMESICICIKLCQIGSCMKHKKKYGVKGTTGNTN